MSAELLAAAQAGDADTVRRLLAAGAHANEPDEAGQTALHLAAQGGHLEAVHALLEAGADANARDANAWTPLFKAAYNHELDCGYAPVVKALVEAGAEVDARIFYGLTPLMLAAGAGEAAVCEVLLNAGADVKAANGQGAILRRRHQPAARGGGLCHGNRGRRQLRQFRQGAPIRG